MTGRQITETYSHFISSRYRWYGWVAGFIGASGVFLQAWFDPESYYGYFISILIGLGLGFLVYIFNHRYQLLYHFNQRYPDAFERLEKYLMEKRERWDKTYPIRLAFMAVLALVMLLLLFLSRESKWTGNITAIFIALLLAHMVKGWLDFNDEILLHDIRRSIRDQTSE